METGEILKHVDHTALKAFCTWADIQKLCGGGHHLRHGIGVRTAVLHSKNP